MREKSGKTLHKFLFGCLLVIAIVLAAEFSLRAYHKLRRHIPFFATLKGYLYDKDLGWKGKFIMGDPASKKFKIFIVGDSFTDGMGIKEERMYYGEIIRHFDAELFVYGGAGYGTLQELLVIDKYMDEIKPDLVILQVCHNDFVNNYWQLQKKSLINDDLMIKPYLVEGTLKYIAPRGLCGLAILLDSRLLYFIYYKTADFLGRLAISRYLRSIENDISDKGINVPEFKESVDITDCIIAKIKTRIDKVPMVSFCVDDLQPYLEQFRIIFKKNNVFFIEGVPSALKEAESKGADLYSSDRSHFNEEGNRVCGVFLAQELVKILNDRTNRK